jgi:hypothetical protein
MTEAVRATSNTVGVRFYLRGSSGHGGRGVSDGSFVLGGGHRPRLKIIYGVGQRDSRLHWKYKFHPTPLQVTCLFQRHALQQQPPKASSMAVSLLHPV